MANDPGPLPPPAWLRTFEAAARHESFARAARDLLITQSAVSQQIRLLEHHLGQPLFHRLPRGLRLTEAGKAYLPVVRDGLERLSAGTREVFGQPGSNVVTLRATPGLVDLWLTPRLAAFYAQHPDVELRITSTIWQSEELDSGVDLAIFYGDGAWPGLASRQLTAEWLTPVCAPERAATLTARPDRLADERLLHIDGFQTGWQAWLNAAGMTETVDVRAGSHFDTAITPLRLAESGIGVALGRASLIADRLSRGTLAAPFALRLASDEAFYVVWPADRPLTGEAECFLSWLLATAGADAAAPPETG